MFQHEQVADPRTQPQSGVSELCGFSTPDYQDKPKVIVDGRPWMTSLEPHSTGDHNFSRTSLLERRDPDVVVRQLRERTEQPDFGEHPGGKAVDSHSTGQTSRKTGKPPDTDRGKHETSGGKSSGRR